jgi:acyl-CoA thioester hydrolase
MTNETQVQVRYGETDQMGVVYHGNYVQYLELGRIEWLRSLGISYKKMEEEGIMLPVISLELNFKGSAYYDDLLTIKTTLIKKPLIKIEFKYEIFNDKGKLLTTAKTALAFMDKKTKKPTKCPKYLLDKIE